MPGGQQQKILFAFDFDHSVIDDNSDLYVKKLAPNGDIPAEIKAMYSSYGWNDFMGAIFKYLHNEKVTQNQMLDCMKEIPFIDGMPLLLDYLRHDQFESIIISDANSVFIDCILKNANYSDVFSKVYTNPAWFDDDDCLQLRPYHTQDWCDLSTVNLCKGHILDTHIKESKEKGTEYSMIAYVGDGSNDLCPSLRLRSQDLVFPRKGYSLIKKIAALESGALKAKVIPWSSGHDILAVLKAHSA